VDKSIESIYGWIELIVVENRELTIVEKSISRKYSKLKPISYKTVKKYMSF
jgi:uncharacterized protein involved in tolerance to divalent cations